MLECLRAPFRAPPPTLPAPPPLLPAAAATSAQPRLHPCCAPLPLPATPQEAYAEAEADFAADAGRKGGKRRKSGGEAAAGGGDAEDQFFTTLSAQGRLPKFVELLKFKVGTADVWGCGVAPENTVLAPPGCRCAARCLLSRAEPRDPPRRRA